MRSQSLHEFLRGCTFGGLLALSTGCGVTTQTELADSKAEAAREIAAGVEAGTIGDDSHIRRDLPGVPRGDANSQQATLRRPPEIPRPNAALERAVRADDWATIETLLARRTDLTGMTDDGRSLLHVAAESPTPRAAMLLVRAGADPDCVSLDGETPLDVLRRRKLIPPDAEGLPFEAVLLHRMRDGIERALRLARENLDRGRELNALRRQMLADFEVDRAAFKSRAALFSSRVTGVETALPMRFWDVPTEERPPGWIANYKTSDATPVVRLKSEPVPLPSDFDSPLELPLPPQFDQAVEFAHIAVLEAGLAYGVRAREFREVVERAKQIVREAEIGRRG